MLLEQAGIRLDEGVLRAPQLPQDPAGIAEMGEAPAPQIHHPARVVRLTEMTDDPQRQIRQIDATAGIAEGSLPALLQEEPAKAPGMQILVLLDLPKLLGVGPVGEARPELRCLEALGHRDLRVPVADVLLDTEDLPVPFPANRAVRQEVGDYEAEHLVVLQGSRQPLGQRLERQVSVFQSDLLKGVQYLL